MTEDSLARAYGATSPSELTATYDDWAQTYEADMTRVGYRHPALAVAMTARHVVPGAGPVLDAGAGTGLVGEWLALLGYRPLVGVDASEGMLAVAREKAVYDELRHGMIGALPWEDASFAAVVSSGVFTTGHVGADGLVDLLRVLRPGGTAVLTVKETLWRGPMADALADVPADAASPGGVEVIDESSPYLSMPNEPSASPSLVVALRLPSVTV